MHEISIGTKRLNMTPEERTKGIRQIKCGNLKRPFTFFTDKKLCDKSKHRFNLFAYVVCLTLKTGGLLNIGQI